MKCFMSYTRAHRSCATLLIHPSIHPPSQQQRVCVCRPPVSQPFMLQVAAWGALLAWNKRGEIRLFSPSLIVFHFCKSFDFHVDGAALITAENCPGEMRQSDKIRRADPHPDKKDKEESHHPTWRLISIQSRDYRSQNSHRRSRSND